MQQFKTASRSAGELKTAKAELDEIFSVVKGSGGKLNPKGVKKLEDNRYEIAELILQLINDTVLITDPLPFLVEPVDGVLGNQYIFQRLDSTLRVVNRSYGSKPLSQRLVFKEFALSTTSKEVAVEIPLEEIAVGRVTASLVADTMAQAIQRYRVKNVLDAIDAGVPAATADHTGKAGYNLRYTDLTQANLDNAIDGLQDENESPTIFARHIAINPKIRTFAGFAAGATQWPQTTMEEFVARGAIGTYHGATIVSLRDQFRLADSSHLLAANKAWIGSGKPGAMFQTKDVSFLDWSLVDPRTSTFGVGTRLEDGVLVFDPYQYRIIENIT